jgi:hypothetical protein
MEPVEIGEHVVYVDPIARKYNALVTNVFGPTCVNVIIVEKSEAQTDSYGRKLKRFSSVSHKSTTPAHGNYWMRPGEEPNPIVTGTAYEEA